MYILVLQNNCNIQSRNKLLQVADARNIMTRDGRSLTCRSFEVTDGSTDNTVPLILWEKDWVERSAFWEPKQTVLFLSDARIAYDDYKKKTALSVGALQVIVQDTMKENCHPDYSAQNSNGSSKDVQRTSYILSFKEHPQDVS